MGHPYKGCGSQAEKGRSRYRAEGGKVLNFPGTLETADRMRDSFERATRTVAQNRGTSPEELKRQFPSAKILAGPGANK